MPNSKEKMDFRLCMTGSCGLTQNKLPYFRGDRGKHVYERFMIVRCPNIIPKEKRDPQLLDKLLNEKEAIVSVAIEYLKQAIERGYQFTESEFMTCERDDYEIENNSLLCFVSECCQIGNGYTRRSEFNKIYVQWCRINAVQPERSREIGIFFGKRTSWKPAREMVCTSILWRLKMKNWKNLKKSSGKQGKTIAFPVVQNTKINLRNDRVCPKKCSRTSDKNMLFWNTRI